ncbi:methylated-DNA--[protein]-cysteine S-methyltransferase [Cellulomonas sp. APG4]|uniref:methylated-DNA--[protein]-cysteine S-methyltransferase n=1 Tax=Cellulomonas sp. APG4 TaxID=1538656 RepID=UPI00137A34B6|nr:methylated-DNA--[protein]-cysteine S-methyltransferase [Cellulomonas sp. APG4]NCT89816.1 methylated-DNA--[protein]-cysteine S-methyltransferase [Cellulomonas sp. APG4]
MTIPTNDTWSRDDLGGVPRETHLATLREHLVARGEAERLVDVTYRTVASPVGELLVAATPLGVVRVAFDVEGHERVLEDLARRVGVRILASPRRLDPVARQLEEYFAHRRTTFDVPMDLRLSSGFRRRVLAHLSEIGYGATESYAQVAVAAGSPRAVRAVGSACATNPLPVVVPCHRVLRSDGTLGGYVGGLDAKRALLALEAA